MFCISPLSLHLFTFNKGFVWTVRDSFCQNKDVLFLQVNTQRVKVVHITEINSACCRCLVPICAPTEEEHCQLCHLPRAAAHGSLTFRNHVSHMKPAGFSRGLWSAGNTDKVMQFSLIPSCASYHNLLAVLLRHSVALLLCTAIQNRWRIEVTFSNVLWRKVFLK